MKKGKKILSILLVLTFLLPFLPLQARAAGGSFGDGLSWSLDSSGTLTISGKGAMPVFANIYAPPWSNYGSSIKRVIVQEGVTTIGRCSFTNCSNLTSVSIAATVTGIYDMAFQGTGLEEVTIPKSVSTLDGAFERAEKLKKVTLEEGVSSVGSRAFAFCPALQSIILPASLKTIDPQAFMGSANLTSIQVASGNAAYCSDNGALLTKDKTRLVIVPDGKSGTYTVPGTVTTVGEFSFNECTKITKVVLPEGVKTIETYAFFGCENMTAIQLPDTLTSLGYAAFAYCESLNSISLPGKLEKLDYYTFDGCTALSEVYFRGNPPAVIEPGAFDGITATVYYPSGNSAWTKALMQNYAGTLTWLPYDYQGGGTIPNLEACTLSELTDVDYLAFAQIAYMAFDAYAAETINGRRHNVQSALEGMGKWSKKWSGDILYSDLCAHIAGWQVYTYLNQSNMNGFYAVAFINDNDEVVIAYRGSKPLDQVDEDSIDDAYCDWIQNDLPAELMDTMGPQYISALYMYETVAKNRTASQIAATGHSLGGGLADIVSVYSGCSATTFNAISILDSAFDYDPHRLGRRFTGVDAFPFVDHTNQYDILAGMFEEILSVSIKPYIAHKTENSKLSLVANHGLKSIAGRNGTSGVTMNAVAKTFTAKKAISMTLSNGKSLATSPYYFGDALDLGTSSGDRLDAGSWQRMGRTSYGGSGGDTIIGGIYADVLIGGQGSDTLDGGRGDDTYIYFRGDGTDTIHDVDGSDTLYLYGFDGIPISVYDNPYTTYVELKTSSGTFLYISKEKREYKLAAFDHFKIVMEDGSEYDITDAFYEFSSGERLIIMCPVNVLVTDSAGNVVYTLEDGVVGSHYTPYGNFYVYQEENGGYGKVLELAEGYSVRIEGVENGAMDIAASDMVDGEMGEEYLVEEIPVSEAFSGTIEQADSGEFVLVADHDGDGEEDERIPLEPRQNVIRLSGKNRYDTAFAVADQLKEKLGGTQFSTVVVAYGRNFPDALTGSYLAAVKNAPILLTEKSADNKVLTYIEENLASGGKIYILGGTAAVTQEFEDGAKALGFQVERLKGKDRYLTNLEILNAAGVTADQKILIATGENYADSLSASATGLPMLLVRGKTLSESQKAFLANTSKNFVILGGTGAVSEEIEAELAAIGTVERVKGKTRYETSVEIAKFFFSAPGSAVLAYAQDFPDGLCAGPLAIAMKAPLILTTNANLAAADAYIENISSGVVTGGTARISDEAVREIFELAVDAGIPVN